jgi:RNA polymerase sigma factor (TIGR02999 family)
MTEKGAITHRLDDWLQGDDSAFDELVPMVYEDLRRIARQQLARLRPGQQLNTTALVNESYEKLQRGQEPDLEGRQHFFAVAACAMRQIIVDHARRMVSEKRSGIEVSLDLDRIPGSSEEHADQILMVEQLLTRLHDINPDLVRLVECRYFAGYTQRETASILGISLRTMQRHWRQTSIWLRELASQ